MTQQKKSKYGQTHQNYFDQVTAEAGGTCRLKLMSDPRSCHPMEK
jgi:hypothetical protein